MLFWLLIAAFALNRPIVFLKPNEVHRRSLEGFRWIALVGYNLSVLVHTWECGVQHIHVLLIRRVNSLHTCYLLHSLRMSECPRQY